LQQFIEDALDVSAVPVALGIFYVFRDPTDQQDFLSARTRRTVDWTQLGHRLGLRKPRVRIDLYEQHRELLDAFYRSALNLGRMPGPHEFAREAELIDQLKSPERAYKIILEKFGAETLEKAREVRTGDLLVYLALSNIRRAVSFRHLSDKLRSDVRSFFGDWRTALAKSREALFAAGDPGEIELACEGLDLGWQDEYSLMIHRSLLNELPPLLRIYVHCAAHRYGDPSQADLIKIHKRSGKVTFQHFDDFDGKPLPELQTRIKVNLRSLFVEVFDHSKGPKTQLLCFKERFVSNAYPNRAAMERFSAKLEKLGFEEKTIGFGPDKETFLRVLEGAGLNERLNPLRKRRQDRTGLSSLSYLTGKAK
jgi:DNA phosphorothioation-associated putative methyltransferase